MLTTLSLSVENLQETRSECTHMSSVVEPRKGLLVDHSGSRWFLVDWQILGKHRAFLVAVSNTLPTGGSSVQGPCSRAYVVSHLKCASVLWKCVRSLRHWPHCFSVPLLFGSIAFQFHCFAVPLPAHHFGRMQLMSNATQLCGEEEAPREAVARSLSTA